MNAFLRRFIFAFAAIAFLAPCGAFADTTIALAQAAPQAPLDRYFGKLEMSPLGVINAIKHVSERADAKQVDVVSALAGLALVEDSIKDWEAQFPGDAWLPRVVLSIDRVYRKFDDDRARSNAARTDTWITSRYPDSDEAHTVLGEIDARNGAAEAAYAAKIDPTPDVLKP